ASREPVAMSLPSLDQATVCTGASCPASSLTSLLVLRSHIFTSPGSAACCHDPDADASRLPSGENATIQTRNLCPDRVARSFRLAVSQSLTVASWQPIASVVPSGETAMPYTVLVSASSDPTSRPTPASRTVNSPSSPLVASHRPSGE